MNIAVFCSANDDIAQEHFDFARRLGLWMAASGHALVFGGCNTGLMECIGSTVAGAGGTVIGVVPSIVERGRRVSDSVTVEIRCDSLSDRKDLMTAKCDVAVALPGGIGTLDEVFTMAAAASIGYHRKRVVVANIGGFWDSLAAMLADLQAKGALRPHWDDTLCIANTFEELTQMIENG